MNWNRGDEVGFGKLHQESANPNQDSSRVDLESGNHQLNLMRRGLELAIRQLDLSEVDLELANQQLDLSRRDLVFEKEELEMTIVNVFSEKTIEDFSERKQVPKGSVLICNFAMEIFKKPHHGVAVFEHLCFCPRDDQFQGVALGVA